MSVRGERHDRERVFVSRRSRDSAIRWGVALLLVLAGGYLLVRAYAPYLTDLSEFRAFVLGFGVWAPLVFVAIQSAHVVVAPIPGQVTGVAAGYLFGPLWGSIYSIAGIAIGSTLAFWLARRYGRAYVERIVTPETLARFDGLAADNAQTALLLAFLLPGLPDDALCFVGGLTDVPLRRLVLVAVVGRAPSFVLSALVGAEAAGENWATAALLAVLLAALSVLGYLQRDRLTGYLD